MLRFGNIGDRGNNFFERFDPYCLYCLDSRQLFVVTFELAWPSKTFDRRWLRFYRLGVCTLGFDNFCIFCGPGHRV